MYAVKRATDLFLFTLLAVAVCGCTSDTTEPAAEPSAPAQQAPDADAGAADAEQAVPVAEQQPLKKAELLVELPKELANTPDAMTLLPDGNIILSVPNFNEPKLPPLLMKITAENDAVPFIELPNHPETEKPVGPLGVCVAPNGDLFFADYQQTGERQSRVMRVVMKEGLPSEIVPVITGFHVANAVLVHDGHLYVTDTQIDAKAKPTISGVLRFKLDELDTTIVKLADNELDDPHLLATIETHNEELPLGADGLAFDDKGNLYIGNFSDGTVHRFTFDADGKVATNEIFAKADFMKSADGLFRDPQSGVIYVTDSKANAVQMVYPDGTVKTLAQNGDTDGLDGGMDQPCEVLLRGRELIVSNMDWPVPGCINQKYDEPCTLSVIKLGDL